MHAIPFVKCTPVASSICSEVVACTLLEDAQERGPAAPLDDNNPHSFMIMSELSLELDIFHKNEVAVSGDSIERMNTTSLQEN